MSNYNNYWENEVTSPERFLSSPGDYLEARGYVLSYENKSDSSETIYVKQFGEEQVRIIFSNHRFRVAGLKHGARFINFSGPSKLASEELDGLELIVKPVKQ